MKKRVLKRIVCLLCVIALAFTFFPIPVNAEIKRIDSRKAVEAYLEQELLRRNKVIQFQSDTYNISVSQLADISRSIKEKIRKNYASSGDYLYEILGSASYMRTAVPNGGKYMYRYTVNMSYQETLAQSQWTERRVEAVLKQLKIKKYGKYKRVKLISQWIIKNIEYDYGYQKSSAYQTLMSKRGTCMGYSLLAYQMLTRAGIKCRIVRGHLGTSYHMWNAVRLGGKYYYLDTCWMDSGRNPKEPNYAYFLFGKAKCRQERTIQKGYETMDISKKRYVKR